MKQFTWWTVTVVPLFVHEILARSRIVGGQDGSIEDYSYLVSLQRNGSHFCCGSILNQRMVLTASHCTSAVNETQREFFTIRCGSSTRNKGGEVCKVKNIIEHPDYNNKTMDYDVAILILAVPLTFSPSVQPINMPNAPLSVGSYCTVSGWGMLAEGGRLANQLQTVNLQIVNQTDCKKSYSKLSDKMICAGVPGGGRDSCQGDSGSALITKDADGTCIQHGIVSFGKGCGRRDYPGVYTYIYHQRIRDFIVLISEAYTTTEDDS